MIPLQFPLKVSFFGGGGGGELIRYSFLVQKMKLLTNFRKFTLVFIVKYYFAITVNNDLQIYTYLTYINTYVWHTYILYEYIRKEGYSEIKFRGCVK